MDTSKKIAPIWKFTLTIILCESVGIVSGLLASANNNDWFNTLDKPSWNPPGYLFGPVWTILYLLMGVSLGLIWTNNSLELQKRNAYLLFFTQLFLNFWWSILFFNFHSTAFALLDIILMVIVILLTIESFFHFSKLAAWLLIPYIAWVSFATILNFSIWNLNN